MKISVVIPCYNEKATIRAVVDTVKAAPFADKEIIIVDDCSRDGTRDVLQAMEKAESPKPGVNRTSGAGLVRTPWTSSAAFAATSSSTASTCSGSHE